ncbi:MAG: lipopolysaccharide kinase InaA family protein [Phycisphaerae bacterium]
MALPSTDNPLIRRAGPGTPGLVEPDSPDLAAEFARLALPPGSAWKVVKRNPVRTVYFGRLAGQDVYLKHFHIRSPIRMLADSLRGSSVQREVKAWRCLGELGVPTPEILAADKCGESEWLATRAVADAERADLWHSRQLGEGQAGRRAIRQAAEALAEMIARMHQGGIVHNDLHGGNILIRTTDAGPQPVLMDLHRVRRRQWWWQWRKLSRRARAANLAQLYHDRACFTTRTERLRFLKHYLLASGASGSLRRWQVRVEDAARRHSRRQYVRCDRRTLRKNRYFGRVRLARGWRGHVVLATKIPPVGSAAGALEFRLEDWQKVLASPEVLFLGDVKVIKDSPSTQVVRRTLVVGPHRLEVFIKRFRRKFLWRVVLDCFRWARSIRAFKLGHALLNRRIPTALPLVALDRRLGPVLMDSLLITEAVEAPNLHEFLRTRLESRPKSGASLTAAQQHRLAREMPWQFGRFVQRLSDNGFAHRDLKAENLLIRWSPGRPIEVILVDLEGLRRSYGLDVGRCFKGLMRLNVSLMECPAVNRTGRLRMLMGYLRRPGYWRVEFKPYWRILDEWSARKLRRLLQVRRSRPGAMGRASS